MSVAPMVRTGRDGRVALALGIGGGSGIDRYGILLFFHVVGAIVWIGFVLTGHALSVWAERNDEWVLAARLQPAFEWIERPGIIFGPLLLLLTGIGLVLDGPWSFGDTWILIGLGGYGSALALGLAFQAPGMRRLDVMIRDRGPEDPAAIALARRLNALLWPELAILTVVLLSMTTKPTGAGSVGFWAVVAAVLAGSGVLTARGFRATGVRPEA